MAGEGLVYGRLSSIHGGVGGACIIASSTFLFGGLLSVQHRLQVCFVRLGHMCVVLGV